MNLLTPNSFGALEEHGDPNRPGPYPHKRRKTGHLPRPKAATSSGPTVIGSVPILEGVNFEQNAQRMLDDVAAHRRSVGSDLTPRDQSFAEAALRALPLVHGTSALGAVAAITEGLFSNADMRSKSEALRQQVIELRDIMHDMLLGQRGNVDVVRYMSAREIADAFKLSLEDAMEVRTMSNELADLQKVVLGTTADADRAVGLDKFVFMTHGALHEDYGPIGVVIHNRVIDRADTWATSEDIADTSGPSGRAYAPEHVRDYQRTMVQGEGYFKVAAGEAGTIGRVIKRGKSRLFEVKTPRVNPQDVLGFVVQGNYNEAVRLRDLLAAKGITKKVLLVSHGTSPRLVYRQMKHLQRTGQWSDDLSGGGAVAIL